ncbi:MAG: hypothetical protein ACLGID_15205 [Gammaproteobacteria bacterium]
MRGLNKICVTVFFAAGLISHAVIVNAEGDVAKDVRTDVRDADKDADRAKHYVDKEAKHLDKERHKGDRHVDKEVKKDL